MRCGNMYEAGDIVISYVPFADTDGLKVRPAVILFAAYGNIVMAGITCNPHMKGIPLTKEDGVVEDSVIKTNYIFTASEARIKKKVTKLSLSKRKLVFDSMVSHLHALISS